MCLPYFFSPPLPLTRQPFFLPSSIYSATPDFQKQSRGGDFTSFFLTVIPEGPFVIINSEAAEAACCVCFWGALFGRNVGSFPSFYLSICASVCVFCVVPHFHLTRNISSFFSLHVFHISMKKNKSFFVTEGEYVCGSMKGFLIEQRQLGDKLPHPILSHSHVAGLVMDAKPVDRVHLSSHVLL